MSLPIYWDQQEQIMSIQTPYLTLAKPFDEMLTWATHQLEELGFQVEQTFDLQAARQSHIGCPCPHHGTDQCSCQMVILLVRNRGSDPTTMVLHGNDEQTNFTLVRQIGGHSDQNLKTRLSEALF
jgi:hypothetical protein